MLTRHLRLDACLKAMIPSCLYVCLWRNSMTAGLRGKWYVITLQDFTCITHFTGEAFPWRLFMQSWPIALRHNTHARTHTHKTAICVQTAIALCSRSCTGCSFNDTVPNRTVMNMRWQANDCRITEGSNSRFPMRLWDGLPYNSMYSFRRFELTYCLLLHCELIQSIWSFLHVQPKRSNKYIKIHVGKVRNYNTTVTGSLRDVIWVQVKRGTTAFQGGGLQPDRTGLGVLLPDFVTVPIWRQNKRAW